MNENMLSVRYVGRREPWVENLYGSGLTFAKGQQRLLPDSLARKLMRHVDLFELGDTQQASDSEHGNAQAKGDAELAKAQEQAKLQQEQDSNRQDLMDRIMIMDKDGLTDFAYSNFEQKLDKRKSVENMREEVAGFVDRFGVA